MNSSFRDNFNYLVAFIAVLFGLGVFKDFASTNTILIFGFEATIIQFSIPFIILMLLAVYIGALAMLSKNIYFSLVPLTRVLENISYFLASIGLMYPLLLGVSFVLSWISDLIPENINLEGIGQVLTAMLGALVAILAQRLASSRAKDRYSTILNEIKDLINSNEKPADQAKASPYEIISLYNQFISLSRSILRLKGYGISGNETRDVRRLLEMQNILTDSDLKKVDTARNIRNQVAHSSKPPTNKTLLEGRLIIEELIMKLEQEIVTLDIHSD